MTKYFQPFFLFVLVLVSFPALNRSLRTLQAIAPGPWSFFDIPPGSSPIPGPILPPPPTSGGGGSGSGSGGGGSGGGSASESGKGNGSSGLSGGQKAGIVMGVLAGAGLIGFTTILYMKRRSNLRSARFGVLARRSQL